MSSSLHISMQYPLYHIPDRVHRIVGTIMLIAALVWIALLVYASFAAIFFFFISLTMACPAFVVVFELPIAAAGSITGSLLVLWSRWKIAGYILFVSAFVLPRFLP